MPNKQTPSDQDLIDALRRRARADLKKDLLAREEKLEPIPSGTAKVRRFAPWKIAAVLLPLIAAALWLILGQSPDYQQLAANNTFPYPNVAAPIVRGPEAPAAQSLREALADYEAGRYEAANTGLMALPATDTTAFYRAVIAANQEDWATADQQLAAVPNSSTFNVAADYFRALSALQAGKSDEAKAMLLPEEKWAPYPGLAKRVRGLLNSLK